ncbi:MAG: CPBP family intramembrane metalloprotease [Candidatus Methanoplasma sp.]|nr:CPBP family intramembrane metalloprotease [Candidatus Methanoplasma sp.]
MQETIPPTECPRCREFVEQGKRYCGACGRCLSGDESGVKKYTLIDIDRRPFFSVTFIVSLFVAVILVTELLYLLVHTGDVFSDMGIRSALPFPFVSPTTAFAPYYVSRDLLFNQIYWLFVVFVISASVACALFRFGGAVKDSIKKKIKSPVENSAVFWICALLCSVLLMDVIYVNVITLMGHSVIDPLAGLIADTNHRYVYANAPVWEELATRVFYIGVPMTVAALVITKKKDALRSVLGGFGLSWLAIILIIVSSLIFGFAHAPSSGPYKIIPAAYLGLALGYLYTRFGLYAAVAFHFAYNYRFVFAWAVSDTFMGGIVTLLTLAGIATSIYIIYEIVKRKDGFRSIPWFVLRKNNV